MDYNYCHVVAEIGCTHVGSVERAKELITLAHLCGADCVKLQKRNPDECVPEYLKHQPHPNQMFSYGATYLEHRRALELEKSDHKRLLDYAHHIGIQFGCSVWDITSAQEMIDISVDFIKIPSPCNTNMELLNYVFDHYLGPIHISTGMTEFHEFSELKQFLLGKIQEIVVYHCTSEYPCPFEHLYLKEIEKLRNFADVQVGFSNHGYGIAADIAAYVLGAEWIERHFIDDRTFRHTDASASLEPEGLRKLCRDLRAVQKAMQYKTGITKEELRQRKKLRKEND